MSDEYSHDMDVTDDVGEDLIDRLSKTQDLIEYHMNIIRLVDMVSLAKEQMETVYNNMSAKELDNEHSLVFNEKLTTNLEIH